MPFFGLIKESDNNLTIIQNHIILIFKLYVYHSRERGFLNLDNLLNEFTRVKIVEKKTASVSIEKTIQFNKGWQVANFLSNLILSTQLSWFLFFIYLFVYLFVCLFIYLFIYVFIYLSIYLFIYSFIFLNFAIHECLRDGGNKGLMRIIVVISF